MTPTESDYPDLVDAIREYQAAITLLGQAGFPQQYELARVIMLAARLGAIQTTLQYLRDDLSRERDRHRPGY